MWLDLKVVVLSYRLCQDLVESLVCTHANLKIENRLEIYESGMLPWNIEMTIEESVSDNVDGVPHCASDSESASGTES